MNPECVPNPKPVTRETHERGRQRSRHLFALLCLAIVAALGADTAFAELRPRTLRWQPSVSAGVNSYVLSVGTSSGNYTEQLALGLPGVVGGEMTAVVELDDSREHYLALRAWNGTDYSAHSNEYVVPVGSASGPVTATLGVVSDENGTISLVMADGRKEAIASHIDNPAIHDLRPAWCDLDLDGVEDLVLGFGPGGGAMLEVIYMRPGVVVQSMSLRIDDYVSFSTSKSGGSYAVENGELWPACGDVDGDGRNEIIVGLGAGSSFKLHAIDDAFALHVPMWPPGSLLPVAFGGIRDVGVAAIPAVGDIDGDGRDEIVVGQGEFGDGRLNMFDDAVFGFAPILSDFDLPSHPSAVPSIVVGDPSTYSGGVYPALGDLDGDGLDEIVLGLGAGSGGMLHAIGIQEGEPKPWEKHPPALLQAGWPTYQIADGRTRPALADVDGDGRLEFAIGFGPGGEGLVQLFDDLATGPSPLALPGAPDGIVDSLTNGLVAPAISSE